MRSLTDVRRIEDVGASGMEVCEPGEVVDFGVDDYPLQYYERRVVLSTR